MTLADRFETWVRQYEQRGVEVSSGLTMRSTSDSTAKVDRTNKKALHQNIFHTLEYFWFSPITQEFAGFRLMGKQDVAIPADARDWRWSEVLGLAPGVANGRFALFR